MTNKPSVNSMVIVQDNQQEIVVKSIFPSIQYIHRHVSFPD